MKTIIYNDGNPIKVLTAANKHPLVDSMNFFDRFESFMKLILIVLMKYNKFKFQSVFNSSLSPFCVYASMGWPGSFPQSTVSGKFRIEFHSSKIVAY